MSATTKVDYDTDFVEWTAQEARLLRERRFSELDLENLAEEIEDLGKRDARDARSQLVRMLMHLVKLRIQPERASKSWRQSIAGAQDNIQDALRDSPSLRRHLSDNLQETYERAIRRALKETHLEPRAPHLGLPATCPYTLDELLTADLDDLARPR